MDSFAYHNAIRHHLLTQIRAIKAHNRTPYTGEMLERWDLLQAFLYEVEAFPHQDFHPENASADALTFLMETLPANFPTLLKPFQQICKELQRALQKITALPTVPHRKALTKTEWEMVWANFDAKLKHKKGGRFIDESEASFTYIQNFIEEAEMLYCVGFFNHQYCYELSGKWFAEMYDGSCLYWIDANFEWAFLGDGHGYPKYFGDFIY